MSFIKFLSQAQFHGAIRLAEKHYRWWWSLAMTLLFGCSVAVLWVTVRRFLDNPTFLVRQETVYTALPFPSVLVCPEITFHDDKIEQFVDELSHPPGLNASYLKSIMRQLAAFFSPDVLYTRRELEDLEYVLDYNRLEIDTAGKKLMTTCDETLIRCRWNGSIVNCSSLFQMELTGDGFCCVFNGRSLSREILEYGIENKVYKVSGEQWYTEGYGFASGLMLAVNQTQKLDNVDLSYKWIALQSHQHYVETTVNGTPLNPGSEQWVGYTTEGFQIADEARSMSDHLRHCRMANEPLNWFPFYHKFLITTECFPCARKNYCILECEIARTIDRCHCSLPVHPRLPGVRQCRARSIPCARHAMLSSDTNECVCPQACDMTAGIVQTSSFELMSNVHPYDKFYEGLNFSKVTIVRAFVSSRNIKVKSRRPYFSSLDLFSQLGGVFNVFFGVSILSILELIQLLWKGLRYNRTNKIADFHSKQNTAIPSKKKQTKKFKNKKPKNKLIKLISTPKRIL